MYQTDSYKPKPKISTGFPEKFALKIFKRFLKGIILGILLFIYLNLEFLLLAAQDLIPDLAAIDLESSSLMLGSEPPDIAPILILFSVVGIVFSVINNCWSGHLYWFYGVRKPKNLFLTLAIIISVLLIVTLAGIAATCFDKYFEEKVLNLVVVVTSISSCLLFYFAVDLIYTFYEHQKKTCKNCNLTNVLRVKNEILSTSKKESGYWDNGGYSTEHYKVNGEDVSITRSTAPEYHETYELTSHVYETCYCPICEKTAHTRSRIYKT